MRELTPDTIRKSEVRLIGGKSPAAMVPIDDPAMKVAANAYHAAFGVEPVYNAGGWFNSDSGFSAERTECASFADGFWLAGR